MNDELIERIKAAMRSDDMPDFDYVQDMEARILPTTDPMDDPRVQVLVECVLRINAACDAMWNDRNRVTGQTIKEKHMKAISEAQQRFPDALAALEA